MVGEAEPQPKRLVALGYDTAAEAYEQAARAHLGRDQRATYLQAALALTPQGAPVLDLGCGTGAHGTATLAGHCRTVGVDISHRSVALARLAIPNATFLVGDMATAEFAACSFELVTAFYSLIHVPRAEHGAVVERVFRWLRPGGHLVLTMGLNAWEGTEEHWLGATRMFWSHWDADTNRRLISDAGFSALRADEVIHDEDGRAVGFLWVLAQRPPEP